MFLPTGELPRVFLSDEEIEELKEVVLCGPQKLPNMMKEVVLFKKYHLASLSHGKMLFYTACCSMGGFIRSTHLYIHFFSIKMTTKSLHRGQWQQKMP